MTATTDWGKMISFIWTVKEVLRDHYKRHEYGEVILPMVVLRRLDSTLAEPRKAGGASRKAAVLARAATLAKPYDVHNDLLCSSAGLEFYNTSMFDFGNLLGDEEAVKENFTDYLTGYSENVRDVIGSFDLYSHIERLAEGGILYQVIGRFASPVVDLSPVRVSNHDMGYVYEELIRGAAELQNEEAGEHFTPREVIDLMVNLLIADETELHKRGKVVTVYDPACGTGGMLTHAEAKLKAVNSSIRVHLRGQEIQPESYAICRSDMLITNERTADIRRGDTLANDRFPDDRWAFQLSNPPYGKDWKTIEATVKAEHKNRGFAGRFGPGLPSTTDGQMLFLLHMIARMKGPDQGGGRIAIVMNGSPLFTGDAGSGPSEIRRYLLENDLVEAIVGLPTEMFYNTGINTYIWVVTNRKAAERAGHVQLIDARTMFAKMPKSLGNKRNYLTAGNITDIVKLYEDMAEHERSLILPISAFGYRQVTAERPLRLSYKVDEEVVATLGTNSVIAKLDERERQSILEAAIGVSGWKSNDSAEAASVAEKIGNGVRRPTALVKKAVLAAMSFRDPVGEVVTDRKGPLCDPQLRDVIKVPLEQDVDEFFATEVLPFVQDAWLDSEKDRIGYEIPFTRLFFRYTPPRALAEIDADLKASQQRIIALIAEVAE